MIVKQFPFSSEEYTLTESGEFLVITNNEPILDVKTIVSFSDVLTPNDDNIIRSFRWGYDGITFSEWIVLLDNNSFNKIRTDSYSRFYLEFKYELIGNISVTIKDLKFVFEFIDDKWLNFKPFPQAYKRTSGNRHYPVKNNLFTRKPYDGQNPVIKLHEDLSYISNELYGHDVSYFRANPELESKDVIFLEYTIYHREDPKCCKVLVPNNEFPDNKYNFNALGPDFEMPFEINIDRRYFEHIFGHAKSPQKYDLIYFPLVDRMYEVQSSTIVRSFMSNPIWYKLNLVKYQDNTFIQQTPEIQDTLDKYTTGFEELIGHELKSDIEDIYNPIQTTIQSTHSDIVREYIFDEYVNIKKELILNLNTTISEYNYRFTDSYDIYGEVDGVRYAANDIWKIDDDRSFSCWFNIEKKTQKPKNVTEIIKLTENTYRIKSRFLPVNNLSTDDYISINNRTSNNTVTIGKILYINTNTKDIYVDIEIEPYFNDVLDIDWYVNVLDYSYDISYKQSLFYNYNSDLNEGIIIELFINKFIKITIDENVAWFNINYTIINNQWYGIIINFGNKFNQLSAYLYYIQPSSNKSNKLINVYSGLIENPPKKDRLQLNNISLKISAVKITNIRWNNEIVPLERHQNYLNQQLMTDSSHCIIIDNALPHSKLPYIGVPK